MVGYQHELTPANTGDDSPGRIPASLEVDGQHVLVNIPEQGISRSGLVLVITRELINCRDHAQGKNPNELVVPIPEGCEWGMIWRELFGWGISSVPSFLANAILTPLPPDQEDDLFRSIREALDRVVTGQTRYKHDFREKLKAEAREEVDDCIAWLRERGEQDLSGFGILLNGDGIQISSYWRKMEYGCQHDFKQGCKASTVLQLLEQYRNSAESILFYHYSLYQEPYDDLFYQRLYNVCE